MYTVKYEGKYNQSITQDQNIKFMVSSKGCIGCQDTNSDVMLAIDSIRDGETDIKQIFMTNQETLELIQSLEKSLLRNKDYDEEEAI